MIGFFLFFLAGFFSNKFELSLILFISGFALEIVDYKIIKDRISEQYKKEINKLREDVMSKFMELNDCKKELKKYKGIVEKYKKRLEEIYEALPEQKKLEEILRKTLKEKE